MASWIGTGGSNPGDVATNGKIGIGTTNPQAKLDVSKPTQDSNAALSIIGNGYLWVNPNPVAGYCNPLVQAGDKAIIFNSGAADTGALVIGQWSTSAKGIRINSSGNIGIGVTNPDAKLDVQGATANYLLRSKITSGIGSAIYGHANNQSIGVQGACDGGSGGIAVQGQAYGASTGGYFTSESGLALHTGTGNVQIDGKFGIGTASPGDKLSVGNKVLISDSSNPTAPSNGVVLFFNGTNLIARQSGKTDKNLTNW